MSRKSSERYKKKKVYCEYVSVCVYQVCIHFMVKIISNIGIQHFFRVVKYTRILKKKLI